MEGAVFQARYSKKTIITALIVFFVLAAIGVLGICYSLTGIFYAPIATDYIILTISVILLLAAFSSLAMVILFFKDCEDLYYNDKMVRIRKDKVIFELPYKNLVSVKVSSGGNLSFYGEKPFYKKRESLKTCYRGEDNFRVKQIILSANGGLEI